VVPANSDTTTIDTPAREDEENAVRSDPGVLAAKATDHRNTPVPAVLDPEDREEAGYGYGV
jgi:hypothetical protein